MPGFASALFFLSGNRKASWGEISQTTVSSCLGFHLLIIYLEDFDSATQQKAVAPAEHGSASAQLIRALV